MWNVDRHVARAMVDDRADREVKDRGLPVPSPDPLEAVNRQRTVRSRSLFRHRLVALLERWNLFCRWLGRLGRPSGCDEAPAR